MSLSKQQLDIAQRSHRATGKVKKNLSQCSITLIKLQMCCLHFFVFSFSKIGRWLRKWNSWQSFLRWPIGGSLLCLTAGSWLRFPAGEESFCVAFTCSLCVCVGFLRVFWLLPPSGTGFTTLCSVSLHSFLSRSWRSRPVLMVLQWCHPHLSAHQIWWREPSNRSPSSATAPQISTSITRLLTCPLPPHWTSTTAP